MANEEFKITEQDQRRLIIDLLIRVTSENNAITQVLIGALSQGDPTRAKAMMQDFQQRFQTENKKLREIIFANYGRLDLDDNLKEE